MRGGIQSVYNTDTIRRMLMKRRGGGQEEDRNVKKRRIVNIQENDKKRVKRSINRTEPL